ncbi:hypothetical protein MMC25_007074 [Agyrium rufum]|nr:hypothetical protein [Agyrium rufum]
MAEDRYIMKTLPSTLVTTSNNRNEQPMSHDEVRLAHFGKRQRFRRNFSLISIVGLSCTLMLTWEGSLALLQPLLLNGGPTGALAAFLFVMFGVLLQVLVMAEMASMIPLSGGQYNWVAVLAPPAWSNFLSYLTGWITTVAWQAATASTVYLNATIIQALVVLNYPHYDYQRWHGTLIFYAIIATALFVNTYMGRVFPKFEALVLVLHVAGFFAILITLVYLSPKTASANVFQHFINGGGWDTDVESFLVGTVTSMFAFIGVDAAAHMAEEIENAPKVIPQSMIIAVILNGSLGFGLLVAILFTSGPADDILGSTFFFPFIVVFQTSTKSVVGATVMVLL